jgi:formiminoglutamase
MNLKDYFEPVSLNTEYRLGEKNVFGPLVDKYLAGGDFPGWEKADIAIIGISDYRGVRKDNCCNTANEARKLLYQLTRPGSKIKVADLGNLRTGTTPDDSLAALRDTIRMLTGSKTIPLILGGTRAQTLGMFRAYELNDRAVNLTAVDSRPGLASDHYADLKQKSFLSSIISSKSRYLFNYSNIGYQSYFAGTDETDLLDDMYFDFFRLGMVRENISEMEPVIRDSDLLVISMSSVRQSDAPASVFPSPNGFTGEEVCQLAWYGGQSERLSSLAVLDWHSGYDTRNQTGHLAAHIAWYFIDGFYKRKNEYPFNRAGDCIKYIVNMAGSGIDIAFYKSNKSNRWWMEVPSSRLTSGLMVACSYQDYQRACRQEVPDRWWRNFKKINN